LLCALVPIASTFPLIAIDVPKPVALPTPTEPKRINWLVTGEML